MLFINSSLIAQTPANAILSSFPWWFWVLLVVAGAAKVLSETAPKKRHRHNRWTGVNHDGTPHAVANGNLMPCPDCKKPISMKASTCPHCGAPIADDYVKTVQSERNLNRRRAQKTKDILIQKNGAFVTVVFVSMLFVVFHFSSGVWTWILSAPLVLLMVAGICEAIKLGDKGYLADDCEFKTPRPEGVVFFNELPSYIANFTERVIKDDDVDEIVKTIREWNDSVTAAQRANHVTNLKARHRR